MLSRSRAHWLPLLLLVGLGTWPGVGTSARADAPAADAAASGVKIPAAHSPGIRAIADMNELRGELAPLRRRHGAEAVLVVFDLDNTLLAAEDLAGSDAWYTWQEALETGGNKPHRVCSDIEYEAANAVLEDERLLRKRPSVEEIEVYRLKGAALLEVQGALYQVGRMRRTQSDVDDVVRDLQRVGHPTMVLTSRGPEFRGPTFRELGRNGLSFACSAPGCCPLPTCVLRWTAQDLGQFNAQERACFDPGLRLVDVNMLYEAGVYMTSGGHKGAALRALLARLRTSVSAIVFVDDTWKHLDRMRSAFALTNVEMHNLYYTREHARVRAFMADTAGSQWDQTKAVVDAFVGTQRYTCAQEELRRWRRPACCAVSR